MLHGQDLLVVFGAGVIFSEIVPMTEAVAVPANLNACSG